MDRRIQGRRVFGESRGPLSVTRVDLSRDVTAHDHDFLEVVVIAAGRATHQSIYGRRNLARGDLLVIRPGFWHGYLDCRRLVVWNCCMVPGLLGELRWADPDHAASDLLWVGGLGGGRRGLMEARLPEADCRAALSHLRHLQRTPPGTLAQAGRLLMFLDVVVQRFAHARSASPASDQVHPAVRRTLARIEQDLAHDWSLEALAQVAGLARAYLVRLFRRQIGASPIELVNRLRCERAAGLLLSTDLSISQIAHQVGWLDPGYFARRFRAQFDQSPTEYRDTMRS